MFWRLMSTRLALPVLSAFARQSHPSLLCQCSKFICDDTYLKLGAWQNDRQKWATKITDTETFWLRVLNKDNSPDTGIFEEDIKMAWRLADNETLPEVIKLTSKLLDPNNKKNLFTSFQYGSMMMRSCYLLKNPDAAMLIFNDPVLFGQFNNSSTVIILMDMLIKFGKPAEAVHVYKKVKTLELFFIRRDPCVNLLYAVALYKEGTEEAFEEAKAFVKQLVLPLKDKARVEDTVALHALKLKKPSDAISLLHHRYADYATSWNILIQAFVMQSKRDSVSSAVRNRKHSVNSDTFELLQSSGISLNVQPCKATLEEDVLAPIVQEAKIKKKFFG